MQNDILEASRLQIRRKKSHHSYILTPNHLDETSTNYSRLVIQLQDKYQAGKEPAQDTPIQKPVDYSI